MFQEFCQNKEDRSEDYRKGKARLIEDTPKIVISALEWKTCKRVGENLSSRTGKDEENVIWNKLNKNLCLRYGKCALELIFMRKQIKSNWTRKKKTWHKWKCHLLEGKNGNVWINHSLWCQFLSPSLLSHAWILSWKQLLCLMHFSLWVSFQSQELRLNRVTNGSLKTTVNEPRRGYGYWMQLGPAYL